MSQEAKTQFEEHIRNKIEDHTFERQLFLPELWEVDKNVTVGWQSVIPFTTGITQAITRTVVKCGLPFQEFVDLVAPKTNFGHDPVEVLYKLFQACIPMARRIFTAYNTPLRLLHANEYVLEKAFVYGIMSLSKWLGTEWKCGVHNWPPEMPPDLVPKYPGVQIVHVDTAASSQAASSSHAGAAASSSNKHECCTPALSQAAPSSSGTGHEASSSPSSSEKKQKTKAIEV